MRVLRLTLPLEFRAVVRMPAGAEVLGVGMLPPFGMTPETPYVLVLSAPESELTQRKLCAVRTGESPIAGYRYVGTILQTERREGTRTQVLWHVFDGGEREITNVS